MVTKEKKTKILADHRLNEKDTGSSDVQVALLTARIEEMTRHMKTNKKDYSSRRGLLQMVSRRRSLLDYLARTDKGRYSKLIERLNLRK